MSKVHLVYESWGTCDDSTCVGAFFDKQKADEYISEHMKPRIKELEQETSCKKCRCVDEKDYWTANYDEVFTLEDTCPIAKIGTYRNGKYCENEIIGYCGMKSNEYWKESIEIIG